MYFDSHCILDYDLIQCPFNDSVKWNDIILGGYLNLAILKTNNSFIFDDLFCLNCCVCFDNDRFDSFKNGISPCLSAYYEIREFHFNLV